MNSDTGKAYTTEETVAEAIARGERVVPISEKAARTIVASRQALAHLRRRERQLKAKRRVRSRMAKASRKGNR